jgi:hypothetical protein
MRKAFILSDFVIISIILSAIAGMLLSTSLLSYQNSKTEFAAQKKTFFASMLKNAEQKCMNIADPDNDQYIFEYNKVISEYYIYLSATCSKKEDSPNVYIVKYHECVYGEETAFASGDFNENNCKNGERYVSI